MKYILRLFWLSCLLSLLTLEIFLLSGRQSKITNQFEQVYRPIPADVNVSYTNIMLFGDGQAVETMPVAFASALDVNQTISNGAMPRDFYSAMLNEGNTVTDSASNAAPSLSTLIKANSQSTQKQTTISVDDTPPVLPSTRQTDDGSLIYVVQSGDRALNIAARYGVDFDDLLAVNDIQNADNLQIGQELIIPLDEASTNATRLYVVRRGDIPMTIADRFGVSTEDLLAQNNIIDPTSLQVGQELIIPLPNPNLASQNFLGPKIFHQVVAGDTFLDLAVKYGSTAAAIETANPDIPAKRLQLDQVLVIPLINPISAQPARQASRPRANTNTRARYNTVSLASLSVTPLETQNLLEEQMIALVNAQRAANGLSPYQVGPLISGVAKAHAQDMVNRGYFAHTTPEGVTVNARLRVNDVSFTRASENIQRNYRPAGESAQAAFNWFMNSRIHRSNLLSATYTQIGVGAVEGPPGWFTFVLKFTLPE